MPEDKSRLVYSTESAVPRKDKPAPQRPAPAVPSDRQQVCVRLERKGRGGKSVSVIEGLHLSRQELERLLNQLKSRLGTGGALKDNAIEIQGDHRDALCRMLQEAGFRPRKSGG